MKITTKLKDKNLAEIYQSTQLKMALLNPMGPDEYERVTPFVQCRDFLTDTLTYSLAKKDFSIYGMSFKGSESQIDFSGIHLLLDFGKKELREIFERQLPHVHAIEKVNGIPKTQMYHYENEQYLILGSKKWMQNCLHFSLYTFLLRVLCMPIQGEGYWLTVLSETKDNKTKQKNTDAKYISSIKEKTWKKILGDLSKLETKEFCGIPVSDNVHQVHHNSGIISVFGTHSEISCYDLVKLNIHWKKMKSRGFEMHPDAEAVAAANG